MDDDLDRVIAEIASEHGLQPELMPELVTETGVLLMHEAIPLLTPQSWATHAPWLPVLAEAFVEWARRANTATTQPNFVKQDQSGACA